MNFHNLEYFSVVAEEMNMTRAAERLFISQQSLSSHIRHLESILGVKLFFRTPRLQLTYAGQRLLLSARRILDIRRQIVQEMDDINHQRRGELRVGISHTRGRVFLPRLLPEFCQSHPGIDVRVTEGNSRQLEEWLQHGHIDLVVGFAPILLAEAESRSILSERLFLVVPKKIMADLYGDKAATMARQFATGVDVASFQTCPYLMMSTGNRTRTIFDRYMESIGIPVQVLLEMESIETLFSLACEGMGITVYPEMFISGLSRFIQIDADSPVNLFPLNDPSTIGDLVVAYHSGRYLSDAARDFMAACQAVRQHLELA